MTIRTHLQKRQLKLMLSAIANLLCILTLTAQDKPATTTPETAKATITGGVAKTASDFNEAADKALAAMKKLAEDQNMKGVALVAYAEGDTVKSWSSKMVVVRTMTDPPTGNGRGNNLLGIAYSKAAEMADTIKDSGSKARPLLAGENGYQGGAVAKGKTGILIAAFSGGRSEDDYKVSQAGLAVLAASGL